jgi:hypothetical protein
MTSTGTGSAANCGSSPYTGFDGNGPKPMTSTERLGNELLGAEHLGLPAPVVPLPLQLVAVLLDL